MVASWVQQPKNLDMMIEPESASSEVLQSGWPHSNKNVKPNRALKNLDVSPDIVEKFLSVTFVDPRNQRDNKVLENDRENIRRKLAMEAGKEKTDSSCDLQLCFVNEIASSEDDTSEGLEGESGDIGMANISTKASQIIVPLVVSPDKSPELIQTKSNSFMNDAKLERASRYSRHSIASGYPSQSTEDNQSNAHDEFQVEVSRLQESAKEGLLQARLHAKVLIEERKNKRIISNEKLFNLLGIPSSSKVNRMTLSRLNVAQLQLIQNDYLSQIKALNDELLDLLVSKDDLVVSQDAILTDIEDLSQFIKIDKKT